MNYKKSVMGFSALLVLFYHFFVPFTTSTIEQFLLKATYIGVDLFILMSAISLGKRDKIQFGSFMKNRLINIYVPFFIMSLINTLYKKLPFISFIKSVCGIEFLQNGGGAFMWYAPAIMIVYLLTPLFVKVKTKTGKYFLPAALGAWFVFGAFVQYVLKQPQLFILICRLPVFFVGLCFEKISSSISKKTRVIINAAFLAAGIVIAYMFGFKTRLNVPFKDFYFALSIPLVLGVRSLFELIYSSGKVKLHICEFLGSFTLEIYGLQMIFGYSLMNALCKLTNIYQLAFLLTCIIIIAVSYVFHILYGMVKKYTKLEK